MCRVFRWVSICGVKCCVRLLCGIVKVVLSVCRFEWVNIVMVLVGRLLCLIGIGFRVVSRWLLFMFRCGCRWVSM